MRFGKTLKTSIYPPWKDHYVEYNKLKNLLREHDADPSTDGEGGSTWTEEDEEAFVQELINVQMEKVNSFQVETYKKLRDRTSECEAKLEPLVVKEDKKEGATEESSSSKDRLGRSEEAKRSIAAEVQDQLDKITNDVNELKRFSRVNFTGFLKAAKKHDRKRGTRYKVRPLLQVRLSQLPFNTEDYSPLLYRLSTMYSFIRPILTPDQKEAPEADTGFGSDYTSYSYWVHVDNILEVKTRILRQLPVLVYNSQYSKDLDLLPMDPSMTSLYFDSPKFDLYSQKVSRASEAGSLRLRWTGKLNDKPEIFLEKKTVTDDDRSREARVQIKEKYIQPFLNGEYKLEKTIQKMENKGNGENTQAIEALKKNVEEIQSFIKDNDLQPVLRANYTRTAFQIPGNDKIRISLDTDLALIREDSLDTDRPCREPTDWHRKDIDDAQMEFPFSSIRTGEITRFPHALLDIKIKGKIGRNMEWVSDLMASHLVKPEPRFSKFVHGVAQLFEDNVNSFPFWLSELDADIRRDPETAFQEEQEKIAKRAEDEFAVGSFLGGPRQGSPVPTSMGSPVRKVSTYETRPSVGSRVPSGEPAISGRQPAPAEETEVAGPSSRQEEIPSRSGLSSILPSLSTSRYARALRERQQKESLPPGVKHPGTWLKDTGPVRVEAKVWLANQRTFIKWQHVAVLLGSLALGLYNAAGVDNNIARVVAVIYICFAVFAGAWGWGMYIYRSKLIRERSGKDFDNMFGPLVVCFGLALALVLNFGFKYAAVKSQPAESTSYTPDQAITHNMSSPISDSYLLVNQPGQ
ncbi:Phosphate metabolism transcription protein [Arachnomyces sp. PD_36]|nr:Phosphate metabolism transcription protein [Arachnomyces sp. PD_36]